MRLINNFYYVVIVNYIFNSFDVVTSSSTYNFITIVCFLWQAAVNCRIYRHEISITGTTVI